MALFLVKNFSDEISNLLHKNLHWLFLSKNGFSVSLKYSTPVGKLYKVYDATNMFKSNLNPTLRNFSSNKFYNFLTST